MIFPVGDGSKQTFENLWYIAQGFGNPTTYGFHEGADINLKTGGDTDLGQELKTIATGKILYYHNFHANTANTFGRHIVYRIEGAFGVRWIHYAHCLDTGFLGSIQDVPEGKVIAYLGKSGTTAAHLHMAVFKVDPASLYAGIDSIAHTQADLNNWEDPINFLNTWMIPMAIPPSTPAISDLNTKLDFQNFVTPLENYGVIDFGTVKSKILAKDNRIKELEGRIQAAKNVLG